MALGRCSLAGWEVDATHSARPPPTQGEEGTKAGPATTDIQAPRTLPPSVLSLDISGSVRTEGTRSRADPPKSTRRHWSSGRGADESKTRTSAVAHSTRWQTGLSPLSTATEFWRRSVCLTSNRSSPCSSSIRGLRQNSKNLASEKLLGEYSVTHTRR